MRDALSEKGRKEQLRLDVNLVLSAGRPPNGRAEDILKVSCRVVTIRLMHYYTCTCISWYIYSTCKGVVWDELLFFNVALLSRNEYDAGHAASTKM